MAEASERELEHLAAKETLLAIAFEVLDAWSTAPMRQSGKEGLPVFDKKSQFAYSTRDFGAYEVRALDERLPVVGYFVWLESSRQLGIEIAIDRAHDRGMVVMTIRSDKRAVVQPAAGIRRAKRVSDIDLSTDDGKERAKAAMVETIGELVLVNLYSRDF